MEIPPAILSLTSKVDEICKNLVHTLRRSHYSQTVLKLACRIAVFVAVSFLSMGRDGRSGIQAAKRVLKLHFCCRNLAVFPCGPTARFLPCVTAA
ncbi:hypothetical protein GDO78_000189 [Eleutherodactylus coqui]|uniref:Uncharacterized protein n=1 Tax=Eleutherodactylus coqui TaxID=57060 RepID=A0A8J6FPV8_ELECQ|nr:hypothetical protein GDO78_000189 [Eleutherodactylus coqui]